jgi:hypothetical protein
MPENTSQTTMKRDLTPINSICLIKFRKRKGGTKVQAKLRMNISRISPISEMKERTRVPIRKKNRLTTGILFFAKY